MAERLRAPAMAWRRWRRLSGLERRLLLQACLCLPLVALGLRGLGLRRLHVLVGRAAPGRARLAAGPASVTWAQAAERSVQAAARLGPRPATCLERSWVLWWFLRRAGIAGELVIGVRKCGDRLAAHAWVELDGVPLNDAPDVAQHFPPFPAPVTSTLAWSSPAVAEATAKTPAQAGGN